MENLNLAEARKRLFSALDHVLQVSQIKFDREKTQNKTRQSWGRLIVQTVNAYGKLLDGVQLDKLEKRLAKIEENL